MTAKRPLVRRLTVSALAVVLGTGLATVAAYPALADQCTLFISPKNSSGNYAVTVSCGRDTVTGFALWGQDEIFDEFRGSFFSSSVTVTPDVLNEDDSVFNREDDIYAKAGGVDFFGNPFNAVMTNVIHRRF
jgi:hypothetical protein